MTLHVLIPVVVTVAFIQIDAIMGSPSVTITSSLPLGDGIVCDQQEMVLTCDSTQPGLVISCQWSNRSHQGCNITVIATLIKVIYTCVASDGNGPIGTANITVLANGAPPVIRRGDFSNFIAANAGNNLTLFTVITSGLGLSSGSLTWLRTYQRLPSTAQLSSYTINKTTYSVISLYDLSFYDDSGNYTSTASNECGTSSVFVYIEVRKKLCSNNGTAPTLASAPQDYATAEGEFVSFSCKFNGAANGYSLALVSYWVINYGSAKVFIYDNSTSHFYMAVYPTCAVDDLACCQFASRLTVYKASVILNNATVSCVEFLQTFDQDQAQTSAHAKLTVYGLPKVTIGPSSITAQPMQTAKFNCHFKAPSQNGITEVVWLKDDFEIPLSSRYVVSVATGSLLTDDHIESTLQVFNISSDDEGNYACYCYYNRSLVMSAKFITSNVESATLQVRAADNNKESVSGNLIVTIISSSAIVCVSFIIICTIAWIYYMRSRNHHQLLVDLSADKGHMYDDTLEEKQPLLIKEAPPGYMAHSDGDMNSPRKGFMGDEETIKTLSSPIEYSHIVDV